MVYFQQPGSNKTHGVFDLNPSCLKAKESCPLFSICGGCCWCLRSCSVAPSVVEVVVEVISYRHQILDYRKPEIDGKCKISRIKWSKKTQKIRIRTLAIAINISSATYSIFLFFHSYLHVSSFYRWVKSIKFLIRLPRTNMDNLDKKVSKWGSISIRFQLYVRTED